MERPPRAHPHGGMLRAKEGAANPHLHVPTPMSQLAPLRSASPPHGDRANLSANSPNAKMSSMVGQASSSGGAAGGDRAAITTLKSDLLLVQAELDARSGLGGVLELQSSLSRFDWRPADTAGNSSNILTLMGLLFMKLNELARVCGARPPTAMRQSRVGDLVAYFHGTSAQAVANGSFGAPFGADAANMLASGFTERSASEHLGAASIAKGESVPAVPLAAPSESEHASHQRGYGGKEYLEEASTPHGTPIVQRNHSSVPRDEHGAHPVVAMDVTAEGDALDRYYGGNVSSHGNSPSHPGAATGPHHSPASAAGAGGNSMQFHTALNAANDKIKRLERQLALFRYLEGTVHQLDYFDATMKLTVGNDALRELGFDVSSLLHAGGTAPTAPAHPDGTTVASGLIPPHTVGRNAYKSTGGNCDAWAAHTHGVVNSSAPLAHGIRRKSSFSQRKPQDAGDGDHSDAGDADSQAEDAGGPPRNYDDIESTAVTALRNLVAFQNSVILLLVEQVRKSSGSKVDRLKRLRDAKSTGAAAPLTQSLSVSGPAALKGQESLGGSQAFVLSASTADAGARSPLKKPGSGRKKSSAGAPPRSPSGDALSRSTSPVREDRTSTPTGPVGDGDDDDDAAVAAQLMKKVGALENALEVQAEKLRREREVNALRHERFLVERARTTTPLVAAAGGYGAVSRGKGGTPAATLPLDVAARPLSRIHLATGSSGSGAGLGGPLARLGNNSTPTPGLGGASALPVLPTRADDVPGGREKAFMRALQEQSTIIKDLQSRQGTAPSPHHGLGPL